MLHKYFLLRLGHLLRWVESLKWLSHRPGNRLLRSGNGSYSQQEELLGAFFLINEGSGEVVLSVAL